jgi:hypothetical protein
LTGLCLHRARQKKPHRDRDNRFSNHAIPSAIYYFREQEACRTGSDLTQSVATDRTITCAVRVRKPDISRFRDAAVILGNFYGMTIFAASGVACMRAAGASSLCNTGCGEAGAEDPVKRK